MEILHVSAECFPAAKVGGLADVVGALPKYQNTGGAIAKVVIPFYDNQYHKENSFSEIFEGLLNLGDVFYNFHILRAESDLGFELYEVKIPGLLDRTNIYSYDDDSDRFLAFQIAVLDWILNRKTKPSLVHCHDHHTGLIPFMISHSVKYKSLKEIPTVFTIHNANYQGQFSHDKIQNIPTFDFSKIGLLDWDGHINPMATAIKCAWRITTVSPSYMVELRSNAKGLEGLLRQEEDKCSGILNGIDSNVWNPATDQYINHNYTEKIKTL